MLLALVLVVVALSGRYGWKKYDDFEWQKAMKARKYADASLTEVSAWRLLDAYAKDKDAAISKYSGKRYFVGGRAFDASLLTENEFSLKTAGIVKFTAGSGGSDDRGDTISPPGSIITQNPSPIHVGGPDVPSCR